MHMPELALAFGETVSQLSSSPASGIGSVLVLRGTWTGQHSCLVNTLPSVSLSPTVWLTDNSWICYKSSYLGTAWLKSMRNEVLNSCSRLAFFTKFQDLQYGHLQRKTNGRSLQGKERKAEYSRTCLSSPHLEGRGQAILDYIVRCVSKKEREGKNGGKEREGNASSQPLLIPAV